MTSLKQRRVPYINRDELKALWRMPERLQADVASNGTYVWNDQERDALVTVMDAVKDSHSLPLLNRE
jgi:hypothetical protein